MADLSVPVVLFLFNRTGTLARVIDVLKDVQPRHMFLVADGPRSDHSGDPANCRAARALVETLKWPCTVVRDYSEENMGCDARITSGLDMVFQQVSEAIIVEDDTLPHPSFFPWCAHMLETYRNQPAVMHVSGRNHLGRWTQDGDGHCLLHHGSAWGWATWRRAWQAQPPYPSTPSDLANITENPAIDPLVVEHFLILQELAIAGELRGWDLKWELRRALLGGLSVVPSANLVANIGFGPDATRNKDGKNIGALTPVAAAPVGDQADRLINDRRLEYWLVLFELMATYVQPHLAWRLARSKLAKHASFAPGDRRFRHHLAPFRDPGGALAVLQHFCASGVPREPLGDLFRALGRAVADDQKVPTPPGGTGAGAREH